MLRRETKIQGCFIIEPEVFYDFRGEYVETWQKNYYQHLLPENVEFVQDDFSRSRQGILRGLHGDPQTWKLVQCPMGELLLGVLDVREGSPTRGVSEFFPLSEKNRWQVLIPAGCANGHLCLTENCLFDYKQTTFYNQQKQFSYHFTSMDWPIRPTAVSDRDRDAIRWIP